MDRAQRRQRRLDQKIWGSGERAGKARDGTKPPVSEASNCESTDQQPPWKCGFCGTDKTPMRRPGPTGPKSLCNACGQRLNKGRIEVMSVNVSQEESTEDVTVYEARIEPSTKDLQAQLHLSDARGLKWQKIAAERAEENKELRTEIECLNLKIKEITDAKPVRHGQLELESKLRAENQNLKGQLELESKLRAENQHLKEKKNELMTVLSNLLKRYSSEMELLQQVLQGAKSSEKNSHHQTSKGLGNGGRNVHESIAEVNVGNEDHDNGHRQLSSKRTGYAFESVEKLINGYESAADVNDNGHRQPSSKRTGYAFESVEKLLNGYESAADVNVEIEQQTPAYSKGQQTNHLGGNGSGNAQLGHTDGSPDNKCLLKTDVFGYLEKEDGHDSEADVTIGGIGGQSSEDAAGGEEHDAPRGLQQALSVVDMKSEEELDLVLTAADRKAALAIVDKEFLMWLNTKLRRPAAKEISFHKSQLTMQGSCPPGEVAFYWTGIQGSLILDKFHAETDIEKPSCEALTTLLRSVLRVEGSKRANDMLWCLVWADCMNSDQLPGYALLPPRDTKRARCFDDEVATRRAKLRNPKSER